MQTLKKSNNVNYYADFEHVFITYCLLLYIINTYYIYYVLYYICLLYLLYIFIIIFIIIITFLL